MPAAALFISSTVISFPMHFPLEMINKTHPRYKTFPARHHFAFGYAATAAPADQAARAHHN